MHRSVITWAFGVATSLALTLTTPLAAQTADPLGLTPVMLPPALDRVLRDYEKHWKAGDGVKLADLFTPDGMTLSSGELPVRGREAIAKTLTKPGGDLMLRAFAFAVDDTVGYIIGGYRYPSSTGPGGKYVLALRKGGDGRWLIAADIENQSARR